MTLRDSPTGKEGIALSSGTKWQELRRFVQSSLRDFGFGKVRKGEMLKEEAGFLVEAIEKMSEQGPVEAQDLITTSVVNVLWRIVAGERLDYADPKLSALVKSVSDVSKSTFPMPSLFLGTTLFPRTLPHLQRLSSLLASLWRRGAVGRHKDRCSRRAGASMGDSGQRG
jgi:hypothetical protein